MGDLYIFADRFVELFLHGFVMQKFFGKYGRMLGSSNMCFTVFLSNGFCVSIIFVACICFNFHFAMRYSNGSNNKKSNNAPIATYSD